ncbi:phosphoribosylglycinamide formyltransferase [Candidatus Peregrinibacteria bacterium]|nr:phosphoribosylglycinamide formyltransferase [Candidatus Peregrinibacteria bacterium]
MFKIAVLASTNGTDLQAIIDELKAGKMPGIELTAVLSNKKDCYALTRAKEQGYQSYFIDPSDKSREEFDRELAEKLQALSVDLIVLVGYMRILTPQFVRRFKRRIINVHPSLIPKYCGKDYFGLSVHEAVLKNKETISGMTIHYVDEEVDSGDIIVQKSCPVDKNDNPDTLKAKVQALEKHWYPEVIRQMASSKD